LKYPNPFLQKPITIEVKNTAKASPNVTTSWLVNEKANGKRPKTLPKTIKKNKEHIYGNSLLISLLIFVWTIEPMSPKVFSVII
jgi:hypothetical protein